MSRTGSFENEAVIPRIKVDSSKMLDEDYSFGRKLGEGTFGIVFEAEDKKDKSKWAVKKITKEQGSSTTAKSWEREVHILRHIRHPNIIQIREIIESDHHVYLVMELCEGGSLTDELQSRGAFSEDVARDLIFQLASAIAYLHRHSVVHRDLKLDNLLITHISTSAMHDCHKTLSVSVAPQRSQSHESLPPQPQSTVHRSGKKSSLQEPSNRLVQTTQETTQKICIKLTDFGLSLELKKTEDTMAEFCGTPLYMAPEILSDRSYSKQCDVWSMGIIMHLLLTGQSPFRAQKEEDLFDEICELIPEKLDLKGSTPRAHKCLSKLLHKNPAYRYSASELLVDPWITGNELDGNRRTNVLELMKEFRTSTQLEENGQPEESPPDKNVESREKRNTKTKVTGVKKSSNVSNTTTKSGASCVQNKKPATTLRQTRTLPVQYGDKSNR